MAEDVREIQQEASNMDVEVETGQKGSLMIGDTG
jgi:hypothetical protein